MPLTSHLPPPTYKLKTLKFWDLAKREIDKIHPTYSAPPTSFFPPPTRQISAPPAPLRTPHLLQAAGEMGNAYEI